MTLSPVIYRERKEKEREREPKQAEKVVYEKPEIPGIVWKFME